MRAVVGRSTSVRIKRIIYTTYKERMSTQPSPNTSKGSPQANEILSLILLLFAQAQRKSLKCIPFGSFTMHIF